jgi:hypothetical protein
VRERELGRWLLSESTGQSRLNDGLDLLLAEDACIAYNVCMQYTIRNIPDYLDAALRDSARAQSKSLNEVAIEALARGAGLAQPRVRQRDLSDIAGSWRKDSAFERALAAQDAVDEEMWR